MGEIKYNIKMKDKMTGQELNEMMASGAIKIIKGRLVSTENEKMDYGPKRKLKSTTDATPLMPVKFKSNKRVINATKVKVDDIKFDSKLEAYMYGLFKAKNIKMELQYVITLQPGFKHNGKTIRAIKWVADFYLPDYNMVVDTKGWATEIFKMKLKLFKHMQHKGGYSHIKKLEFPKNKNECLLLSITLK